MLWAYFDRWSVPTAAQADYLENNLDAKDALYPAWLHYTDIGRAQGRLWPSDKCNTCTESTQSGDTGGITTNCDSSQYNQNIGGCFAQDAHYTDGSHSTNTGTCVGGIDRNTGARCTSTGTGIYGDQYVESHTADAAGAFYTYEEGLTCSDKCRGKHDAAVATMVGASSCHQTGDVCHGGHCGLGFANFDGTNNGEITFNLKMCSKVTSTLNVYKRRCCA